MSLHKEIFFLIIKVGLTLQNSIISFQCCLRNIWETTETILKANYTIVREQEISVSKHKDISTQSISKRSYTDHPCLNIILLNFIYN